MIYYTYRNSLLTIHLAKILMNGRSQAVRLPNDFQLDCDVVYIRKQGEEIIISPEKPSWDDFFDQESAFGDDYLIDREDIIAQDREWF